jgi:N-acetylneuraminate synthase
MDGPDHQFALEPDELKTMVSAVRNTEIALGSGEKAILDVESELHDKARRAVHAVEDISIGETFTEKNLKILRPGEQEAGLHPKFYYDLLGKSAERNISKSDGILWDDVDS